MLETCAIGLNPKKKQKQKQIRKKCNQENPGKTKFSIFRAQSRFNFGSLLIVLYNFVSCAPPKPHKKIENKKKIQTKTKKKNTIIVSATQRSLNNFSKNTNTNNNKFINLSCAHSMKEKRNENYSFICFFNIIYLMTNTKCDRRQF